VGEIVPKHSAILPAYNSIGIYANHMDMARFSDEVDEGYLSVSTELLRWVRAIQKANGVAQPAAAAAAAAEPEETSVSPWWGSSAATQNPSSSPCAEEPAPFPGTSTAPPAMLYPAGSHRPYQFLPGTNTRNPYYQGIPSPPQTAQIGYGPPEWRQPSPQSPATSPHSQQPQRHGGNYIGTVNGNTGQILQGPFDKELNFYNWTGGR
jgi:hypothetical protein